MKTEHMLRVSPVIIVVFLVLTAAALRLPSLTLNSFWLDELYTANLTFLPAKEMLLTLSNDVHPPVFNLIVYLWSLVFGQSEFALRVVPAVCGIATVPISFLLFKRPFGTYTAIAISLLTLVLPGHIYYSQELRSYSLAFLLATVSLGFAFWYLEKPTIKHRWALAAACAALFATHYISLFYIVTLLSIVSVGIHGTWRRKSIKASRLGLATFFLISPILPHFFYTRYKMDSYWPSSVTLDRIKDTILCLFMNDLSLTVMYLLLIIVAVSVAVIKADKRRLTQVLSLSALSFLPLGGVIAVSLITPNVTILIDRIILVFAPPILVLAAVGLTSIPSKVFAPLSLLLVLSVSIWWLYRNSYYTIPTKSDFRSIAKEVAALQAYDNHILFVSLDPRYVTIDRAAYYWNMFGVRTEGFFIPEGVPTVDLVNQIRTAASRAATTKIVFFSQYRPVFKDLLKLCDHYFHREDRKVFSSFMPGNTFLVSYSLH